MGGVPGKRLCTPKRAIEQNYKLNKKQPSE